MRRAVFYLFFDPQGQVDDYITFKLERLRPFADHVFVVSNVELDDANRTKLETVADTIWVRENVGLDVWAYKEALQVFGEHRLAEYDELILMNYTFFGPVGSFEPLFADMDARDLDFWGVTEHGEVEPHPFSPELERMERHLQSHWIGVRASMFTSPAWRSYWDELPMISSYFDSVNRHEGRFTHHFSELGFRHHVAYPLEDYPSLHPIMDDTVQILRDGCPIVKRRSFFADPLYMERRAISGRTIMNVAEARGYPVDLMLANLARTSEPRVLATNLNLLEILPLQDTGAPVPGEPLRTLAVAHVFYSEMAGEILDRFACLPGPHDIVMTTADNASRAAIEQTLSEWGVTGEVRVVASNRGRDISAFLVGCRDLLDPERYDIVVKLHSKRSPQDAPNVGSSFKRHLFDNLLASPGYAANVVRLFGEHSSLGMVFPPVVHIGYPTLGHAWFGNKVGATEEAKRLGITVPFDESTPLATFGSMFIARVKALRPLLEAAYEYEDFPDESDYSDGALTHVLERLMSYAVLSEGYHVREVMTPDSAALNYSFLEYKHQAISSVLPGYPAEQAAYVADLQRDRASLTRLRRGRARKRAARGTGDHARGGPVGADRPAPAAVGPGSGVRGRLAGLYRRSVSRRRSTP
jgi:lipopolysaccharide biosynthesis protein